MSTNDFDLMTHLMHRPGFGATRAELEACSVHDFPFDERMTLPKIFVHVHNLS